MGRDKQPDPIPSQGALLLQYVTCNNNTYLGYVKCLIFFTDFNHIWILSMYF